MGKRLGLRGLLKAYLDIWGYFRVLSSPRPASCERTSGWRRIAIFHLQLSCPLILVLTGPFSAFNDKDKLSGNWRKFSPPLEEDLAPVWGGRAVPLRSSTNWMISKVCARLHGNI
ncbi:hypothetical protein BS47DRAFT_876636 [Hydnum rufescens UP504]|uniref:Uncharacterized protein n=1 Tax=Hydnum rufescens UP504 TaxID=1448309 RepID=A0A9P6DUR7_9AGAM|nr:hypothetical protein BS47DRAFT_876636 [Hydnum rufescens UP504]